MLLTAGLNDSISVNCHVNWATRNITYQRLVEVSAWDIVEV